MSLMFRKSDILKTVVCLALIIVLFSAPVGADIVSVSDFNSLKAAVEKGGMQTILVSNDIDMGYNPKTRKHRRAEGGEFFAVINKR
ncbi:MAG TPA: hypothetical protein O0X74_04430, partial [Methanocorpusculum sp.]|nr:hypothetical protein [Methanocorpusculum sp.]